MMKGLKTRDEQNWLSVFPPPPLYCIGSSLAASPKYTTRLTTVQSPLNIPALDVIVDCWSFLALTSAGPNSVKSGPSQRFWSADLRIAELTPTRFIFMYSHVTNATTPTERSLDDVDEAAKAAAKDNTTPQRWTTARLRPDRSTVCRGRLGLHGKKKSRFRGDDGRP